MTKRRSTKKIGRRRRTLGWAFLTLGVLVAVIWVASGWFTLRFGGRTVRAAAHRGILYAFVSNRSYWAPSLHGGRIVLLSDSVWDGVEKDPPGLRLLSGEPALSARVQSVSMGSLLPAFIRGSVIVPLWIVWSACLGMGGSLLWLAKRAQLRGRRGYCRVCGYYLAGLAEAANCPECGTSGVPA